MNDHSSTERYVKGDGVKGTDDKDENDQDVDDLAKALKEKVNVEDVDKVEPSEAESETTKPKEIPEAKPKEIPEAIRKFASWIETGTVKDILVVTGAGISVAAGIPDFRSPGTGLYDNLSKYDLPYPEAVFDLEFFDENPRPFVTLAKELWPTGIVFQPTLTHCFLTLLARKNLLLRVYSQNIDGLEHLAELPVDRLVECHGHFRAASCVKCKTKAPDIKMVQETVTVKGEVPICGKCHTGYIKPDIVFFGESLPSRFNEFLPRDLASADCCLVLGTSLQVAPVSMIPDRVARNCKRMLLNRELVGTFGSKWTRSRDLYHLGDCDESIVLLAEQLGWLGELQALHAQVKSKK